MDRVSTRTARRDTLVDHEESTAKVPAFAMSLARDLARTPEGQAILHPVRASGLHPVVPPPLRRPGLRLVPQEDEEDDEDQPTSIQRPGLHLIAHTLPCVSGDNDDDKEEDTDLGLDETLRMASAPGPVAAPLASGVVSVELICAPPVQAVQEEEVRLPAPNPSEDAEPAHGRETADEILEPTGEAPYGTRSETKREVKVEVIPVLEPFPDLESSAKRREEPANDPADEVPAGLEHRPGPSRFYWVASIASVIGGCALTAAWTHGPLPARTPHVFTPTHVTSCIAELARPVSPATVRVPVVKRSLATRSAARAAAVRPAARAETTGLVRDVPY